MKRIFILALVLFTGISSFCQTTWKADKNHSKLTFAITHLTISEVTGLFNDFDVTITSAKPDFSDAVIDLTAQTASVNTEIERRDGHLKSADFFDVEKYPTMTFRSTSLQKIGADRYKLYGDLTLHGTTKPVSMELWYRGSIENPNSKAPVAGFQVTGTFNRSDFNFGEKFTSPMLGDEVKVKADGEFSPAK